ncbi:hypothetical protein GCM10007862_07970 [Dyella lipolytica]|uniref:Uncharacterized protein n=1 Tax=Dyella lipolytica TaxID=1867835 RepID=A0ABW8J1I7_9GAMM|nr:hypothetical protein [Dyella lipolytica]GLQ45746.1 hypothetical protein GCM10007862_07970 [Dyella lipolytica]
MNTQGSSHSPWHLSTWSHYITRIVHPTMNASLRQAPVRMTRREALLAMQDQKRREQRAHVLELLREVKEKNRNIPHVKDAGFKSDHSKLKA